MRNSIFVSEYFYDRCRDDFLHLDEKSRATTHDPRCLEQTTDHDLTPETHVPLEMMPSYRQLQ